MRKVEPYRPPDTRVRPHDPDEMHLDSSERHLFDSVAQEHVRICGTRIKLYSQQLSEAVRDGLYDEVTKHVFRGPFSLYAWVSYPENNVSVSDRGATADWKGTIWFPRKELEEVRCPVPAEGDVFEMWKLPYWENASVGPEENPRDIPGRGFYFNVTNVDEDGVLFDNREFVGISASFSRRSEFTPERRMRDQ